MHSSTNSIPSLVQTYRACKLSLPRSWRDNRVLRTSCRYRYAYIGGPIFLSWFGGSNGRWNLAWCGATSGVFDHAHRRASIKDKCKALQSNESSCENCWKWSPIFRVLLWAFLLCWVSNPRRVRALQVWDICSEKVQGELSIAPQWNGWF